MESRIAPMRDGTNADKFMICKMLELSNARSHHAPQNAGISDLLLYTNIRNRQIFGPFQTLFLSGIAVSYETSESNTCF